MQLPIHVTKHLVTEIELRQATEDTGQDFGRDGELFGISLKCKNDSESALANQGVSTKDI